MIMKSRKALCNDHGEMPYKMSPGGDVRRDLRFKEEARRRRALLAAREMSEMQSIVITNRITVPI